MDWKLEASPLHTVSLRCVSQSTFPAVHTSQIETRSPRRRVVNAISCCALTIATALLVGCSDSMLRGGSLVAGSSLSSGGSLTAPTPAPAPAPAPAPEPAPAPAPAPAPTPTPAPEPAPIPPVTQCGSGIAAQDLTGQCRAVPPTPGALEAISAAISVASATVSQTASRVLQVSWQPFGNNTSGYMVYYGKTADTANAFVSDLPTNSGLFNPAAPAVAFNSVSDLGLYVGDSVCFRISAYNLAHTVIAESFLGCTAI